MSNNLQHGYQHRTDHPPLAVALLNDEHKSHRISESDEEASCAQPSSSTYQPLLCTICVEDNIPLLDLAMIPECQHTFCLNCIASWSHIRPCCPNCKAQFDWILIRRDGEGEQISGPFTATGNPPVRLEQINVIRSQSWVQLSEINSAQHDLEHSFVLPSRENAAERAYALAAVTNSAPRIMCEELEDELESRIWEEEERNHANLMRGTRVFSNRRFGRDGFISAGHMSAKARPPQRRKKQGSAGASSSGQHSNVPRKQMNGDKPKSGGRKKKVKKNSRAGIEAAKAAAAAKAEAQKAETQHVEDTVAAPSGNVTMAADSGSSGAGPSSTVESQSAITEG